MGIHFASDLDHDDEARAWRARRETHDTLDHLALIAEEQLAELKHIRVMLTSINDGLAGFGSTARSSVELAQTSKGVNITCKAYQDSDIQDAGTAALEEFGRLYRLTEERMMNGWRETIEQLAEAARKS